jgi:Ca-activated chloride channel family protein
MAGPQTMLGDAIGFAITRFEQSQASTRVLILLTDGNDTGSRMPPKKAAEIASQHDITIYPVSVGDPTTAGEAALDVDSLKEIAEATGGAYLHADDRAGLEDTYRQLDTLEPSTFETESYRPKTPLYRWPLAVAILLLFLYHASLALLAHRAERRAAHA